MGNKVLAGDHLVGAALAAQFPVQNVLDFGVDFGEGLAEGIYEVAGGVHDFSLRNGG
jgi:hypothetical protein